MKSAINHYFTNQKIKQFNFQSIYFPNSLYKH